MHCLPFRLSLFDAHSLANSLRSASAAVQKFCSFRGVTTRVSACPPPHERAKGMITREQKACRRLQPSWWPPVRVYARVAKYPSNSVELQARRCSNVPCRLSQRPLTSPSCSPSYDPTTSTLFAG